MVAKACRRFSQVVQHGDKMGITRGVGYQAGASSKSTTATAAHSRPVGGQACAATVPAGRTGSQPAAGGNSDKPTAMDGIEQNTQPGGAGMPDQPSGPATPRSRGPRANKKVHFAKDATAEMDGAALAGQATPSNINTTNTTSGLTAGGPDDARRHRDTARRGGRRGGMAGAPSARPNTHYTPHLGAHGGAPRGAATTSP